ncbi:30S ribosomal protein S19e [archaeon]|jgi:small subunit ribosomal protein S19e|nr:30S ribosomal protein S19e [archaeon]MBT3730747.1 30S ribosomal protein S19e [archaeon]MBT4669649.1 30S ribosomal protein S19e [archaeon]MBT5030406.1 30S ribosomal protein S19e [archaeon]MBT5288301.1 30S ribosomal protein S19e [archaeon]
MVTVYDVDPSLLIRDAGEELKEVKEVQKPEWAEIVKTGPGQERLPDDQDWWYFRAASVLRKVYTRGPIGVSKLRTYYGTKKNRGVRPEKFYKASGKIIRIVLQQLEAAGYVQYKEKGVHKGRVITGKGQSFLDNVARKSFTDKRKASEAEA